MAPGEARLDALTNRIDGLVNSVGELRGTLTAMLSQWATQENHATAGRQIIHDKVDALTREVGNISIEMRNVTQDVAELKNDIDGKITPAVSGYNLQAARRAGRSEGIAWTSRLFWVMIAGLASVVGFAIHEFLLYFGKR